MDRETLEMKLQLVLGYPDLEAVEARREIVEAFDALGRERDGLFVQAKGLADERESIWLERLADADARTQRIKAERDEAVHQLGLVMNPDAARVEHMKAIEEHVGSAEILGHIERLEEENHSLRVEWEDFSEEVTKLRKEVGQANQELEDGEAKSGTIFDALRKERDGALEGYVLCDKRAAGYLAQIQVLKKERDEAFEGRANAVRDFDFTKTWLDKGMEVAQGFLDTPSDSHIVDRICIIGHERDALKNERDMMEGRLVEQTALADKAKTVVDTAMEDGRRMASRIAVLEDDLGKAYVEVQRLGEMVTKDAKLNSKFIGDVQAGSCLCEYPVIDKARCPVHGDLGDLFEAVMKEGEAFRLAERTVLGLMKRSDAIRSAARGCDYAGRCPIIEVKPPEIPSSLKIHFGVCECGKRYEFFEDCDRKEPSTDLKEAVKRRFKLIMRLVYDYGLAKEEGSSLLKMAETNVSIEIHKLVESGLKFAGEGPIESMTGTARPECLVMKGVKFASGTWPVGITKLVQALRRSFAVDPDDSACDQDLVKALAEFDGKDEEEPAKKWHPGKISSAEFVRDEKGECYPHMRCPDCKGRGGHDRQSMGINEESWNECRRCNGTGILIEVEEE